MSKKAFILIISIVVVIVYVSGRQPDYLTVSYLDVGQGDSIMIRTPEDDIILIDGGPDNKAKYELGPLMPWWKKRIDYIILTHPDYDHYAGLISIVKKYDIGMVYVNGLSSEAYSYSYFMDVLAEKHIPVNIITTHTLLRWPSGVQMHILWPDDSHQDSSSNEQSVTTMLAWGDIKHLMTGDLYQKQEQILVRRGSVSAVEVLKIGHHGSKTSSAPDFLEIVDPRYCIISAGQDNSYNHPHPETLGTMKDIGCLVLQTKDNGTITFDNNDKMIWLR